MTTADRLHDLLSRRVLLLDGAMGTMIQRYTLDEADFRDHPRLREHPTELKGNPDLLVLTRPQIIGDIHEAYLAAGADLVETNTFGAQALSQGDYGLEALSYDLNVAAAQVARERTEKWSRLTPDKPRFVAGSIGPTPRTLSISPKVEDPGFRAVTFAQVRDAYATQVRGLLDGGADVLLVETVFDTLNCKACLVAIEDEFERRGSRVPVMISVTITDKSGRTLSGQTVEAFWISVAHARPFSVGINCALGAADMRPFLRQLAEVAPCWVSCYPNAGLPNAFGGYDETPDDTARLVGEFVREGLAQIVGGCCGTSPDHIAALARHLEPQRPVKLAVPADDFTRFAGLEPLVIRPESNFQMIGERTNVTGSKKFADLIKAGDFGTALEVAQDQVRGGANLLDVNMDEGMLDGVAAMGTFLNLIGSEPDIARLPIVVDSSSWPVLETGLQRLQGKGLCNSLSLKEGEAEFVAKAKLVRRYGHGVVVMAFDEQGQADNTPRRLEILQRAHRILIDQAGFEPTDIVFDPNVLAIGTGIEEHARYAVSFIEAVRELKRMCPGARVSGGISNLSFAFRGNQVVREAMNAAFLYHAIQAGLDMGIVNAGQVAVYSDIEPELLQHVEDVIFDRRPDATERLVQFADKVKGAGKQRTLDLSWRQAPLGERIQHALVSGTVDFIDADIAEALASYPRPLDIIEGPMMDGMRVVGDLFGAGKMFLPQVVKSARVMKKGVALLLPHMQTGTDERTSQGKVLMATVKGDVHDIGKNIVGVVLGCNSYEVIDLGVMVSADRILDEAQRLGADVVGLSGLITPSLDEMVGVAREMQRRGMTQPLLIGGATTSRQHTAVKIAPVYDQPVVHVLDASRAVGTVAGLLSAEQKPEFVRLNADEQNRLRELHFGRTQQPLLSLEEARARRLPPPAQPLPQPRQLGRVIEDVPLTELVPFIDWTMLFVAWELKGRYPKIFDHPEVGPQALELFDNARTLLQRLIDDGSVRARVVYGFWPARSDGDDVLVDSGNGELRFCFPRQQQRRDDGKPHLCLSDFVAQAGDWLGAFAVTGGLGADELAERLRAQHDDYTAILVKTLADRLAEAAAEWLHQRARQLWYAPDERYGLEDLLTEKYQGIRPAFGYPSCPDHSDKQTLWRLLGADDAGIHLTEQLSMVPGASVSGLWFGHPDARYFQLGRVGLDQVADLARRKGMAEAEVARLYGPQLDG
jgi:5-methyltetrahydrofolate--homocysteine methyltransferase